ncbi:MAG: ComEC/Rec2 family competence protein, partial [Thermoanaerobaculia bacterium]|nr:ComEC/Rec2 family competence protein [Thermoanaerobaculia bacterium]
VEPVDVDGRVVEVEGRICGGWQRRGEWRSRSAPLCADWLRVGSRRSLRPPRLWIDLPDDPRAPPVGTRIRARGTLSRFAGLANATEVGPGPWRLRVKSLSLLRRVGRPGPFAHANGALRARCERAVAASGAAERPGVALARALVLGDEAALGEPRRRALRRAGLAHLFAVSGFNLTLVAGFAAVVASAAAGRGPRAALPAVAVLLYLAAVGPEPSMLRASVMAALGLAVFALRRWTPPLQIVALAAFALLLAQPGIVDDVGFQLSFGATVGLVLVAHRWSRALAGLPRPVAAAIATSCAAQAGALPFAVAAFGELAPLAPLWNLVAVPWAALWLLLGMLWLAVALVAPGLAGRLAPLLDAGAAPFALIERLPPSPWVSMPLAGGFLAGAAVSLVAAVLFGCRPAARVLALPAALALAAAGAAPPSRQVAEVAFLDVGQGDAAIVRSSGFCALVDGGGLVGRDLGATVLRPALARRGVARLDLAILSHSDRDHCLGLLELADLLPIGELWSSEAQLATGCGARLAARVDGRVLPLIAGRQLSRGDVTFEVWHPSATARSRPSNAESLMLAVEVGGLRFVFPGDVTVDEEEQARRRAGTSAGVVLKVAHHGAASSTSAAWLAALRPRLAVISAGGRNAYGHPSPAVLDRLRRRGTVVLRTDRDGEIALVRRGAGPWRIQLPGAPRRVPPHG